MHYVSHDGDQLTTMASHIVVVIGALIMVLLFLSCAQTQLSIEQRAVLIERLKMARKQDEDNIRDSATDSAEVRDSFQQAYKADHAIRELRMASTLIVMRFATHLKFLRRHFLKRK